MKNDSNELLQKHCCVFYNDVLIARELGCNVDNSMRLIEYVMASSEQLAYPNMTNTNLKQPQPYKHFNNVSRLRQSLETENTQNKITSWKCDPRNGLKKNMVGNKLNIRNSEPKLSGSLVTSKPSRTKNMSTAKQYTQEKKAYNQRASIKKLQKNKPVSNNLNKKFIEPKTKPPDNVSDSFISNCKQKDVIRDKTHFNSGTTIRKTSSKENIPLNIYRNILKAAKDSCNVCYKYKTSCHCNRDRPNANGSTLKKSKSSRKPMRQVTYVSELDKTVRQKFLHKVPIERKSSGSSTRSSRTNSIDSKSSKDSLNDLRADSIKKVLTKEKLFKVSVSRTVNSPRTSKDILSLKRTPGPNSTLAERKLLFQNNISRRVIHCPLHSKYGNKKYIRALCIAECPHFSTETSIKSQNSDQISSRSNVNKTATSKKENNLSKTPRKNITALTVSKNITSTDKNGQMEVKPNTSQTAKKCLSSVKKSSTGATYRSNKTAASYMIGSNNRILQTKISTDVKTRARSAPTAIPLAKPATATNVRTSSCKKSSFKVSSRGDINKTVLQKRKIRQKSFKLVASRSRSKSLKYKKRPTVNKTIRAKLESENDDDRYNNEDDDDDRGVRKISNIKKTTSVIDGGSLDTAPHELDSLQLSHECEDLDNEIGFADEVIAEYYFELFKSEFPEIVKETNLTKEELVSITPFLLKIFFNIMTVCGRKM